MIVYGVRVAIKQLRDGIKFLENQVKEIIPIPESVNFEIEDILTVIKEKLNTQGIEMFQEWDYFIIGAPFTMMMDNETKQEFYKRIDKIIGSCLGVEIVEKSDHIIG